MPPAGFEPTILAGERPQTYALVRAGTRSCRFPKIEYVTEYTRVNLARFIVRHVWFKNFLFLSDFSSRYSVLKHRVSQHTTQRQWTDCGFCLKSPVLTKPVTTSASWFFCHINMPHFPPLVAVAVCTSFSAGGVNSNCWQQACLGASLGATPRYRRLFPASLICMLLDTVERKVGTAVLCQQWRNGRSRIVITSDTRLRNRFRICYAGKLFKCGQKITPPKVRGFRNL